MVINKEGDYLLTISRTYDRAAKHIMSSTGKWPRCLHQFQRERIFIDHWNTGKSVNTGKEKIDVYRCLICGTYKKIKRLKQRFIKHRRLGGSIQTRSLKGQRVLPRRQYRRKKYWKKMGGK